MNTKNMEKFEVLDSVALVNVEGGDGGATAIIATYLISSAVNYAVSEATASCRKNPKQWFCVKF
ncbi:TPA: bacteriocin [Streptococcus suis]